MRRLKVLIVDDDAASQILLEHVVGSHGFDVTLASDLGTARELIPTICPDVAILDLMLPDGDGLGLVCDIRLVTPTAHVSILTGKENRAFKSYGWMGVEATFSKPINPEEIGEWLEKTRAKINQFGFALESRR